MADEQWDMLSFEHGTVAVIARGNSLIRLCFECTPDAVLALIRSSYPEARQFFQPIIGDCLNQLSEYFMGKRRVFNVTIDQSGLSTFSHKVHQVLQQVPYGSVVAYGELAAMAGSPGAARAVGRVMSSNPFPLLVPCHRVVNADGSIGQYSAAYGRRTKAWLIDFEREISISCTLTP